MASMGKPLPASELGLLPARHIVRPLMRSNKSVALPYYQLPCLHLKVSLHSQLSSITALLGTRPNISQIGASVAVSQGNPSLPTLLAEARPRVSDSNHSKGATRFYIGRFTSLTAAKQACVPSKTSCIQFPQLMQFWPRNRINDVDLSDVAQANTHGSRNANTESSQTWIDSVNEFLVQFSLIQLTGSEPHKHPFVQRVLVRHVTK